MVLLYINNKILFNGIMSFNYAATAVEWWLFFRLKLKKKPCIEMRIYVFNVVFREV